MQRILSDHTQKRVCSPPHNSCTNHCLITTEWHGHILYPHAFKAFKLCRMLSTNGLHIFMQNYVCALELWVPVGTFVMGIKFRL